jgi:hypothetical protein
VRAQPVPKFEGGTEGDILSSVEPFTRVNRRRAARDNLACLAVPDELVYVEGNVLERIHLLQEADPSHGIAGSDPIRWWLTATPTDEVLQRDLHAVTTSALSLDPPTVIAGFPFS